MPDIMCAKTGKERVSAEQVSAAIKDASHVLGITTDTAVAANAPAVASKGATYRGELEVFSRFNSDTELAASLDERDTNLKTVMRDLLGDKSTAAVAKAMGTALATNYASAVEMLGLVAAAADMLEPDRIARIITVAGATSTAYAPERYIVRFTTQLKQLLGGYQPARIETLLTGLWTVAHSGRYWDVTFGCPVDEQPARRRRRNRDADAAAAAAITDMVNANDLTSSGAQNAVVAGLVEERLTYTRQMALLLETLPFSVEHADALSQLGERSRRGETLNPDTVVLMSHISWLIPNDRPESVMSWLVTSVLNSRRDPETNEVAFDTLPKKPKEWAALYPDVSGFGKFPFPHQVYRLHGTALPGTTLGVDLIRTAGELDNNRQFMGNCTGAYRSQMEKGTYVLLRIESGVRTYNAALLHANGKWRAGELNSRFNRGDVPTTVRDGVGTIIKHLNTTPKK